MYHRKISLKKLEIEGKLKQSVAYSRSLDREMNGLKPEVVQLYKQRSQLQIVLTNKGVKKEVIDSILQTGSTDCINNACNVCHVLNTLKPLDQNVKNLTCNYVLIEKCNKNISNEDNIPHHNQANWLIEDCSREEAEKLLFSRCNGTFLIRKSRRGKYALSIVADNKVFHCLILQTERGFGFAEPYTTYPNLKTLVLHYQQASLEEHNDMLRTTLAFPVYSDHVSEA